MAHELLPQYLAWDEVDPQRFPFDAADAAEVVAGLEPATRIPAGPPSPRGRAAMEWDPREGNAWADEMTRALVRRYGRWALGWRWAGGEGDIGGGPVSPVRAWCCVRHSIGTPQETLARVVAGLIEWRTWLEDLAERFARFPLGAGRSEEERRRAWEQGAAHLVTAVVERTDAADAWYAHCRQVLMWFLTRWDVPRDRAEHLVDEAIGGRFESWLEPSPDLVEDVAERLAGSLSAEV